jgi:hypothetical protein
MGYGSLCFTERKGLGRSIGEKALLMGERGMRLFIDPTRLLGVDLG